MRNFALPRGTPVAKMFQGGYLHLRKVEFRTDTNELFNGLLQMGIVVGNLNRISTLINLICCFFLQHIPLLLLTTPSF